MRREQTCFQTQQRKINSTVGRAFFISRDHNCKWQELGLPDEVLHAVQDLGFAKPTTIQKLCLPCAIRDRLDIIGAAETGSGKTLAFAIPIVVRLLELDQAGKLEHSGPSALILTPTRELAVQIKDHTKVLVKYTTLKVAAVIGGLSVHKQERILKKHPEILIATPGRLWYFINEHLQKIRFLVVDETDRMLEKCHFAELEKILNYLNEQTFVFSATLTFCHAPPSRLLHKPEFHKVTTDDKIASIVSMIALRNKRRVIDVTVKFGLAEHLKEARICCSSLEDKDAALYYVLQGYPGRTIIFTNSINCARRLRSLLQSLHFAPYLLFSAMNQKHRLTNLEKFTSVLIATDVAARGLDIKNIQHVVHYQVPRTSEIYVHRSGRTARVDKEGISIMLVDTKDVICYKKICNALNNGVDLPEFPVDVYKFKELKQRVRLATEVESARHRCGTMNATEHWFRQAAKAADITLDEEVLTVAFLASKPLAIT
ncbi:unnamed protein product [Soboliphyme baturini]|uniref:ATP-dependent RNA helicase n=1 Tax=Soboliphyme baturini TaxID=241478 RepID=A0A183IMH3_9BILA|nr:unnamed protein product [Soboliphyme baturini]